ncbi:DNA primase family protein [Citreimonas sp.]|uniref:DNA primase family protein n=1 Tax=Citreimonas sp. TaxID=3036715 RepID=UPI00405929B0
MTDGRDQIRASFEDAEDVDLPEGMVPDDSGQGDDMPPPPPPDDPGDAPPPEAEGAKEPLNDTGNGKRFLLYYGQRAMFVPRVGWHIWDGKRWRLDADNIQVRRLGQKVQDHVVREIPYLTLEDWQIREIEGEPQVRARHAALMAQDEESLSAEEKAELEDLTQKLIWIRKLKDRRSAIKTEHRSFAKTTGNKGRIDALLSEATAHMAREVEDLDADPLTVNTEAGVLRFTVDPGGEGASRTAAVRLEPHAREMPVPGRDRPQLITRMMPVWYDPTAKCPNFDKFLERVQPSAEMRAFLQRWLALSMTGLKIQRFSFFYGSGANGKSVLVDLIAKMLGDYSHSAKIESFTGRNRRGGGDATPDIFPLMGARMVRAAEPEEGERLQEGLIKELTGGEPILVRQLHADFIEVHPFFKLTMSGNHKPDIRGTDDGIWRRVLLVPFDVQIPESERDEKLGEKLFAERAGILNWLVEGLLSYLEGGLQEPQQVLDATLGYRADSDPIGSFLADTCLVTGDPGDFLLARDIIQGFNFWLDMRGEGMWGERTVSLKFRDLVDRYRDPRTGKTYSRAKRKATGYSGIRFDDFFRRELDDAPRDQKGRPVASNAMRSAFGGGGSDDDDWIV